MKIRRPLISRSPIRTFEDSGPAWGRGAERGGGRKALRYGSRAGMALIAVMWLVLLAGLILLGVNRATSLNMAMGHNELESVQARWLARAGVEQAMAILDDDDPADDSAWDLWYEDDLSFMEVELATGTFSVLAPPAEGGAVGIPRYGLVDLTGRLNINEADERQITALPEIESDLVAAILDWRDGNETARPGGAERGYYQRMEFPYEIRNGPFQTLHELLLVRGIDPAVFYEEDTNRNGVLDPNEDDGQTSPPNDNSDGTLQPGLAGWVTVHSYELNQDALGSTRLNVNSADEDELREQLNFSEGLAEAVVEQREDEEFEGLMELTEVDSDQGGGDDDDGDDEEVNEITVEWLAENMDGLTVTDEERLPARINVNTAPHEVLMTLPEMTREIADAIIAYRRSSRGPFMGWDDLLGGDLLEEEMFRAVAEEVTIRSNMFRVTSVGTAGSGIRRRITAVVDRNAGTSRIIYWRHGE